MYIKYPLLLRLEKQKYKGLLRKNFEKVYGTKKQAVKDLSKTNK